MAINPNTNQNAPRKQADGYAKVLFKKQDGTFMSILPDANLYLTQYNSTQPNEKHARLIQLQEEAQEQLEKYEALPTKKAKEEFVKANNGIVPDGTMELPCVIKVNLPKKNEEIPF